MAQTEITVQVYEDINVIKQKLLNLGFTEKDEFTGADYYFTTLRENEVKAATYKQLLDSSIIVRSYKTKFSDEVKSSLLFKNKVLNDNGDVISEEKVTTKVEDVNTAVKILKLAKLVNWVELKQKNAFYELDNKTIIVGTVEGLEGSFMEIEEFDEIKDFSAEEKIDKLVDYAKSFGFKIGTDTSVKKVYMLFNKNK